MTTDPPFVPPPFDDTLPLLLRAARARREAYYITPASASALIYGHQPGTVISPTEDPAPTLPTLVLPVGLSLVEPGDKVAEGRLITGVSAMWWRIIQEIERDPNFPLHEIGWRAFEELSAGRWKLNGFDDVTLTPRSGDRGRDIIARMSGVAGSICIVDQTKAYSPGNPVTATYVQAMVSIVLGAPGVTKAFITTTSRFAPGVSSDPMLKALMPFKLELREGQQTKDWLLANPPSS